MNKNGKTINNEQRAGLVRLLAAELKKVENQSKTSYSISYYSNDWDESDFEDWENREAAKVALELLEKYQVAAKRREIKKLEDEVSDARKRINAAIEKFEKAEEKKRQALIAELKLAIRDTWASTDIEEAKKIVAQFVAVK